MEVDQRFLLLLKSSTFGEGEPDLGDKLLVAFLKMLYESGRLPERIICMNSGVFLTTEGSPVGDLLGTFAAEGTEILSCATCLDYYGRKDKLINGNRQICAIRSIPCFASPK